MWKANDEKLELAAWVHGIRCAARNDFNFTNSDRAPMIQ